MAENLNHKIDEIGNSSCYGDDEDNCQKYGLLYDWYAAMVACPAGWRLPTRQDWRDLIAVAGGSREASEKLISITGWVENSGKDNYGFSALPGGLRGEHDNNFHHVGVFGLWWSATENPNASEKTHGYLFGGVDFSIDGAFYMRLSPIRGYNFAVEQYGIKSPEFSVRCVRE